MKIKVAVFAEKKKKGGGLKLRAYTRDYNPSWSGYNGITVDAENGEDAKKKAIKFVKVLWINHPVLIKLTD